MIDSSINKNIERIAMRLKTIPETPGVYQHLDASGKVIYVGKAKNLLRRVSSYFSHYDDKSAKMAGDRQKELTHGTHEILAGVEYDINDKLTVSCGGQRTDYGLADGYQQNTSFACDSYSIGLGGAWNINEKLRLNAGYFITLYSDYTKTAAYGQETFSRTNNVIGLGIDYKF